MMYGLKPVPFKALSVCSKALSVRSKAVRVRFKAVSVRSKEVSVRFKAVHVARAGLVIGGELCALVFAVGGDRYCDDGDEDDRQNDGDPAQHVEAVVEQAVEAVRVDSAGRFLGREL
jgi:hypothetical protein